MTPKKSSEVRSLVLFSRLPVAGGCKSRLARVLGPDRAAAIARASLLDLCARLSAELEHVHLLLCFDPPDAAQQFQALLAEGAPAVQRFALLPQNGLDLGERLASALQSVRLERPYADVIFIGSDAPELSSEAIHDAFTITRAGRAAILKAQDGGYVLLGLPCNATGGFFDKIRWSSQTTAEQQIARLRVLGSEVVTLPGNGWDIDEASDLEPLLERLRKTPKLAPRTLKLLEEPTPAKRRRGRQ